MVEWYVLAAFTSLITLGIGSLGLFVAYKRLKPAVTRMISEQSNLIQARVAANMNKMVENIDVGELVGQLGGSEGSAPDLGALSGLLGGGSGGIGDLLGLFAQFSGKKGEGKGKIGLK